MSNKEIEGAQVVIGGRITVGVMQGRLSPKRSDNLQSFPADSWREEFDRAAGIGFDAIEWLYDIHDDERNPLLSEAGRTEIRHCSSVSGVAVDSLCAHAFIDGSLNRGERAATESLSRLVEASEALRIERIVLPALEAASLADAEAWRRLVRILRPVLRQCADAGVALALECDLPLDQLCGCLVAIEEPGLGLCYDVGNRVADGHDPAYELPQLADWITEIHIKDRARRGGSCMLGEGDVDFAAVFAWLRESPAPIPIILETPVGNDWRSAGQCNHDFVRAHQLEWVSR